MFPPFAEDFLPAYDVSDSVAVTVPVDAESAWASLLEVDLLELGRRSPAVAALGGLRVLPDLLSRVAHGKRPQPPPESLRLMDLAGMPMQEGGWVLLGEGPGEIALGLIGKFWRPVIEYASIADAEEFRGFQDAGYAKTVYDLRVRSLDTNESVLSGEMRTATTDEHARKWFRRYWTFGVGSGAHLLVGALLSDARERALAGVAA